LFVDVMLRYLLLLFRFGKKVSIAELSRREDERLARFVCAINIEAESSSELR